MIDTPTDKAAAKKALVRTYNTPSYADAWDAVTDYESVQNAAAEHPNKGSSALSSIVDLPRGRIRGWVDGDGQPDCYRGLQTALDAGWIIDDWSHDTAKALNCLAAWVLSSGSINDTWEPVFVTSDERREIEALRSYSRVIGSPVERTRRDDVERPMEWRPTKNGAVLGRILHTWTGVQGYKNETTAQFPQYPAYAPHHIAKQFCHVYVEQRGTDTHHSPEFIQIAATRNDQFRNELVECLQRVVSDPDLIVGDTWPIRVFKPAVSELDGYPDLDG